MSEYTQGFCQDGAAILRDGKPMTIEEVLEGLRYADALAAHVERLRQSGNRVVHYGCDKCEWDDAVAAIPATSLARRDAMVAADTCQALHDEFDCYKNDRDRLKVKTVRFVLSRWKVAFQRKAEEAS